MFVVVLLILNALRVIILDNSLKSTKFHPNDFDDAILVCNQRLFYFVFVVYNELDIKEKSWILIKDSFKNGYNRNEGGDSGLYTAKYSDEQVKLAKIM